MIGSHNTMSYLMPEWWIMRAFAFIGRCQSKTLEEQIASGVKGFDLRIKRNDEGEWVFAHGMLEYDNSVKLKDVLDVLKKRNCYATITLEAEDYRDDEMAFSELCEELSSSDYSNYLVAGYIKKTWRTVWVFGGHGRRGVEARSYSSADMNIRKKGIYAYLPPWCYAKRYNKDDFEKYMCKRDITLAADFV